MKTQLSEAMGDSASATRRPGTWRAREPASPPPQARPPAFDADFDPLAESWAIANPDTGPTWSERWGRRAAAWSTGLAAVVLVTAGAAWMINERKVEQVLATIATTLPAAPPITRAAIEPSEPALLQASDLALPVPELNAELPVFAPTSTPAKKPVRTRALAVKKTPARPLPPRADPAQVRAAQTAETLRQCRAAGYHAEQCVRRGCVATPYGIACKGRRVQASGLKDSARKSIR